jgi:HEAT repeat protein
MSSLDSRRSILRRSAGLLGGLVLLAVTAAGRAPAQEYPQEGGELSRAEKAAALGYVAELVSEAPEASAGAEQQLIAMGGRVVPYLCKLATSGRPDLPVTDVVRILGEIGDARASKTVAAMTSPGHALDLRRTAAEALSRTGGEGAAERLVALLLEAFGKEGSLARAAYNGLIGLARGKDGDSPHAEEIAGLVMDRLNQAGAADDDLRLWLVTLLGEVGHGSAVRQLVELAEASEGNPEIRRRVARALGAIGDGEAAIPLVDLVCDEDPAVGKDAANALGRLSLSEGQKAEVVSLLLEELGLEDATGGELHALVRRALARVTGEGTERNAYKWRTWGVAQGYGDLARPERVEPPEVVYAPPTDVKPDAPTSTPWTYLAAPLVLAALGAGLLYARGASKRQLAAIGTRTANRREPRRAVRAAAQLPIRYRFLGRKEDFEPSKRFKGTTTDVSADGVKLVVTLPDKSWLGDLREERVFLSIEIDLPGDKKPVRAHAVAAWVKPLDAGDKGGKGKGLLGLRFKEMTRLDKDRVLAYVFSRTA